MNILLRLADLTNPFPTSVQPTSSTLQSILNWVFLIVGGLALIFIVIGAFRYIVSGGEPQETSAAKNTIMYAAIGLLVTIGASIIVNFVIGKL
jgi:uncharacterized membrane protein YidH (DUF202 family)